MTRPAAREALPTESASHYRNARNYLRHARGEIGLAWMRHPSQRLKRTMGLWSAFEYLMAAADERTLARTARRQTANQSHSTMEVTDGVDER
jgi:hypothetical protein